MVNPTVPSDYSAVQQQQPQGGGSSKAKKALVNGLTLGVVGAGLGATAFAPKSVDSATSLVALPNDVFKRTLKVSEKAPKEAKDAQAVLSRTRAELEKINNDNVKAVEELFPNQTAEVGIDEVLKKHYPEYPTLTALETEVTRMQTEALKKENLVNALTGLEGKNIRQKISRADLADILNTGGISESEKIAKKIVAPKWKFWRRKEVFNTDKVLQKATGNSKMTANLYQQTHNIMTADLQSLAGMLTNPQMVKNDKISKEVYMNYLQTKSVRPGLEQEITGAFEKVGKYISKKRGAGALKIGGIGLAVGIGLGLLFGGRKKD